MNYFPKLAGEGAKWRGERGELGSGLTGARAALGRPGDGGAERGCIGARWEVAEDSEVNDWERGAVMADAAPRPFIGAEESPGRGGRELIADINGFNAIEGVKAR
jgi:hypothetical protein